MSLMVMNVYSSEFKADAVDLYESDPDHTIAFPSFSGATGGAGE